MWSKPLRAVIFNIAAFAIAFTLLAFGTRLPTAIGLLLSLLILALVFSGVRPGEATAPLRPWEWTTWFVGFAAISIIALAIAAAIQMNIGPLKLVAFCALSWAFVFLIVRDTRLAVRGSKAHGKT